MDRQITFSVILDEQSINCDAIMLLQETRQACNKRVRIACCMSSNNDHRLSKQLGYDAAACQTMNIV